MSRITSRNAGSIGFGTQIEVDGVSLFGTRDIKVHFGLDEPNTVEVEMLAEDGLDLTFEGTIVPTFVVLPGFELQEEQLSDGRKRYTATQERKSDAMSPL